MGSFWFVHFFLVLVFLAIHKCIAFNNSNSLYLKCQFQAVTPYSTPPSTTEHPITDEVHVQSSIASLDDWLHPSGCSSQSVQQVRAFSDWCNTTAASLSVVFCLLQ
jgi:hypothetical protein